MAIKNDNRCLDLFCLTQGVSRESFISQEYNAFDWPRLFLGPFNQIYRSLFNSSATGIDNPAVIIEIFTGIATTFGKIFNIAQGMTNPALISPIMTIWSSYSGEWASVTPMSKDKRDEAYNPYYVLIHCVKGVDFSDINVYNSAVKAVDAFDKTYDVITSKICPKIPKRSMTLGEKNAIKLFKEDRIAKDMNDATAILKAKTKNLNPDLAKKWDELYKRLFEISNKAMKYLADNIDNKMK